MNYVPHSKNPPGQNIKINSFTFAFRYILTSIYMIPLCFTKTYKDIVR